MQTKRYMQSEHMKGIVCIILAAFFFSLMSVFVKLSGDVPTMQKSLFRNLIAAVIAFVTLAGTPEKFSIRRDCIRGLLLRSLFGTIGILCNFWAIDHMIISDANMLNKLSPFFAIIMSCFILKEFPAKREWLLVAGVSAAGGQLSVTAAYRHAPAREISIFDYSQILWAALFGFLIFGAVPDLFSVIGYVIIITAAVIRWSWSRHTA